MVNVLWCGRTASDNSDRLKGVVALYGARDGLLTVAGLYPVGRIGPDLHAAKKNGYELWFVPENHDGNLLYPADPDDVKAVLQAWNALE